MLLRLIFPKSFLENAFSLKIILRHRPFFAHFLKTSLLRTPQIFGGGEDGPKRTGGRTDEVEILKNGRVLKDTLFFSCLGGWGNATAEGGRKHCRAGGVGFGRIFAAHSPTPRLRTPHSYTQKNENI